MSQTANGAVAYLSTYDGVLDFFSQAGAMRDWNCYDHVELFERAWIADRELALKALFYLRDVRGGQGERKVFRTLFKWLVDNYESEVEQMIKYIPEFGRWDDVIQLAPYSKVACDYIIAVFTDDLLKSAKGEPVSLLAKWMPSENASSHNTKALAGFLRKKMGLSCRLYRKSLSLLRKAINVVERDMSAKRWGEINYESVPSQAQTLYRKAFWRNDEERYSAYVDAITNGEKKVNSSTLYPYQITGKFSDSYSYSVSAQEVKLLDAQWKALPNYFEDIKENSLAVVDVSGSMCDRISRSNTNTCMDVAISLGIYIAERNTGVFHNHYMTFSDRPRLQEVVGKDIKEKVHFMRRTDVGYSTNLEGMFNVILNTAVEHAISQEEMVKRLYIISDMQFNDQINDAGKSTLYKYMKEKYAMAGYKMPEIIYWNVNATNGTQPVTKDENDVALVSGFSPSILKALLKNDLDKLSPMGIMMTTLLDDRYKDITC